jgi:CBS domain containing-hemolysin-like protein
LTALLLSAIVLLIFANGFFVAAEFSLVRSRRSRLEEMAAEGDRKARLVIAQLDDLSEYLSACQFGITLASLGIGFLGEPAIAELFEPLLEDFAHAAAAPIAIAIAYILVTAGHITAGEQVPKIYAIVNGERVARWVARPLNVFNKVMRPFIHLLNSASNALLRPLGIKGDADFEEGSSPEEVRAIIAQAHAGGHLDPGEAGMLTGVFHLHDQQARQVMTPIPAVVTVDVSEDVGTALRRCISTGHTRMPVTEDHNADKVRGVVHSNSLARILMADGPEASIEPAVRPVPIVPETKPLDDLLADLQRNRSTMAVVVDEYGRVAGIVTVEDIIEEVVGEIDDETDPAGGDVRQLANGDWYVRGHVAITDLADYHLKLPVDSDAYNSIGGFVFARLGRLPKRGDTVAANGYSMRVESVRENRIEAVRIRERRRQGAVVSREAADDE